MWDSDVLPTAGQCQRTGTGTAARMVLLEFKGRSKNKIEVKNKSKPFLQQYTKAHNMHKMGSLTTYRLLVELAIFNSWSWHRFYFKNKNSQKAPHKSEIDDKHHRNGIAVSYPLNDM